MSKRLNLIGMMLLVASTLVCACSGSKGNKNVIDSNEKEQKAEVFTSPDLLMHDLVGRVKECVVKTEGTDEVFSLKFDNDGNWQISDFYGAMGYYVSASSASANAKRDSNGKITNLFGNSFSCKYNELGKVDSFMFEQMGGTGETTNTYDSNGCLVLQECDGWYGGSTKVHMSSYCSYVITKTDENGNWTERTIKERLIQVEDLDNQTREMYSIPYMESVYGGFEIEKHEKKQSRTITYYDSKNQPAKSEKKEIVENAPKEINIDEKAETLIREFYSKFVFGSTFFPDHGKKYCTPQLFKILCENVEYDEQEQPSFSAFGAETQDWEIEKKYLISVKRVADGTYDVEWYDRGYKGITRLTIIVEGENIKLSSAKKIKDQLIDI